MDDSVSPSASAVPPIPSQPVSLSLPPHLHADFDIAEQSMDPRRMHLALIIMKIAAHLKC